MDMFLETNVFDPSSNILDNSEPDSSEPEIERDDVYYFDTIVFRVENTLFRVPKNGFQVAGSFFETIFSLPQPEGTKEEGSDDTCPLPLHGISKAHFRGFLHVLYPFNGAATTYEEWVGALDLATMWDFKEIRKASVQALSNLITSRDVVENILLAKKYRVKQWLRDGYLKLLIHQVERLNIDELCSSNVDLLTIARLWSTYAMTLAHRPAATTDYYCDYCGNSSRVNAPTEVTSDELEAGPLITQNFADEFRGMEDF